MKIPIIWLNDYLKTSKTPKELADSFTAIGLMLDKPLDESGVLDLEHRMDRSDWLSILGCARDIAAYEETPLQPPKIKLAKVMPTKKAEVPITVTCPEVRRFQTRVFKDVQVKPSPAWLKERLLAYGIESINNVVDITNFVMVECGQPMHAQDIKKLPSKELTLRRAQKGEKLTTFLGTELELTPEMFVISSKGKPVVLGGIVGGLDTGVTTATTDLILDAGNYDQVSVRNTSRKLKISNETVLRYDKFLDPRLTEVAMARATSLLVELTGAKVYENFDYYPNPVSPKTAILNLARLNLISGIEFTLQEAKKILLALGYEITEQSDSAITVEIPYFRTDVEVEDDLVADILRIRGYDKITSQPLKTAIPKDITPAIYNFENKLRTLMSALGAHEHITSSFVVTNSDSDQVVLENALTSEAGALRKSPLETLSPVLTNYDKHNLQDTIIFEIGLGYHKLDDNQKHSSYQESRELVALSQQDIRPTLSAIMQQLQIEYDVQMIAGSYQLTTAKDILGELTLNSLKLNTEKLLKYARPYAPITTDHTNLTTFDISLTLPKEIAFSQIKKEIIRASSSLHQIKVKEKVGHNLLLQLSWKIKLDKAEEKTKILQELQEKLQITSRST